MFLGKNFVNGHEFVEKTGVNISNMAQIKKYVHEKENYSDVVKVGPCIYMNKHSTNLPKGTITLLSTFEHTDMSNLVLDTVVRKELNLTPKELQFVLETNSDFVSIEVHFKKKFIRFTDEFVKLFNKQYYVMSQNEADELSKDEFELIYDLTDKKCVVFYSVFKKD